MSNSGTAEVLHFSFFLRESFARSRVVESEAEDTTLYDITPILNEGISLKQLSCEGLGYHFSQHKSRNRNNGKKETPCISTITKVEQHTSCPPPAKKVFRHGNSIISPELV
eukprot:m.241215 g.241215  ORF g.241215 m.241215 type:complete len:111 (+) comp18876_c0_seq1:848-1180(+)